MENIPSKSTGDNLTADEFNSMLNELKNLILDTLQTLTGADESQMSKSMTNYAASGAFYIDSGAADAYVLSVISPKQAPTALVNGLLVRFVPTNTNTGASTVNAFASGVKTIKKYGGINDLEPGDILAGAVVELIYIEGTDVYEVITVGDPIVKESIPLFKDISGLTISNNSTDPINDIDIQPGSFKSSTSFDAFTLAAALTKKIDANWAVGTDAGGFPSGLTLTADNWYMLFAIAKVDGTVDVGFDNVSNAANLLADATDYVFYRRIGSVFYETGAPNFIRLFTQIGNYFAWTDPAEFTINPPAITKTNITLLTPDGVVTEAHLSMGSTDDNTNGPNYFVVAPLFVSDSTFLTNSLFKTLCGFDIDQDRDIGSTDYVYTNTSSQVWYRFFIAGASGHVFRYVIWGWKELFE